MRRLVFRCLLGYKIFANFLWLNKKWFSKLLYQHQWLQGWCKKKKKLNIHSNNHVYVTLKHKWQILDQPRKYRTTNICILHVKNSFGRSVGSEHRVLYKELEGALAYIRDPACAHFLSWPKQHRVEFNKHKLQCVLHIQRAYRMASARVLLRSHRVCARRITSAPSSSYIDSMVLRRRAE